MTDENAILSSQSITEFIDNVNQFYQLNWPVQFSENSLIWRLWLIMVTVNKGSETDTDSYTVEGEFDFLSSQSPAKVRITAKNLGGN